MPPCHGGGGVRIPRIPQICSKIRVTSLVNHRFESDTKLQKLLSIILFSNFSDYFLNLKIEVMKRKAH